MKIFLAFPLKDGQTGPAIKRAFENLGHEVFAIDARLHPNKLYENYWKFRADLVFCAKLPEITMQIKLIKQNFNPIICIWNMDTRTNVNYWKSLFPLIKLCDYNFIPDTGTLSAWKKINKNTFWLPQGLQDEIYHKPESITETDRARYSSDVCWAGDLGAVHEMRVPFIEALSKMKINFKCWGCRGNPQVYNNEHNKMAALSKINLGCSCWPENGSYTSVRDYKIMGAGGFLLELYRDGIEKLFPLDIFDFYKNEKELAVKIRYWLAHEKERKEIAEKGYKWTHEEATYKHRIIAAINYIEEDLK